jgi:hypothetical protein
MWSIKEGFTKSPAWKPETLRYRFPLVLEWLPESGVELQHVESNQDEGLYNFKFENEKDEVTLMLDDETWLLREMTILSESESLFVFREKYDDYTKIDGTWFPTRYTGSIGHRTIYEYLIPVIELGVDLPDDFFVITESDTTEYVPSKQDSTD